MLIVAHKTFNDFKIHRFKFCHSLIRLYYINVWYALSTGDRMSYCGGNAKILYSTPTESLTMFY